MTEKRFIDGGEECVEDQFLIDTETDTNYWIDKGLDEIIDLLNELSKENEQLKKDREELFIRERDTKNEWRELKQENTILKREYETLLKLVLDSGIDYSISDELEGLE